MTTIEKRANDAVASVEYAADVSEQFIDPSRLSDINTVKGPVKTLAKLSESVAGAAKELEENINGESARIFSVASEVEGKIQEDSARVAVTAVQVEVSLSSESERVISEAEAAISSMVHFSEEVFTPGANYPNGRIYFVDAGIAYTPVSFPFIAGSSVLDDKNSSKLIILQGLTNSMLGSGLDQIPTNRYVDSNIKYFEGVSDAVAAIALEPTRYIRVETDSFRTRSECSAVGIVYPDGGASRYEVGVWGVADGCSIIDAGIRQLKLLHNGSYVSLLQFGAIRVVGFDNDSSISSAISFHAENDIELKIPVGVFEDGAPVREPFGNIHITGVKGRSWIKYHSSRSQLEGWLANRNQDAPVRTVTLLIDGVSFDGSLLSPKRWLQTLSGVAITDPESDYYDATTNPSGKIGHPSFPDYGIDDLIVADRRNPEYTQTSSILDLRGLAGGRVSNCIFKDHFGRAITEGGGKDVDICWNVFDTIGKNDGPFGAIWTQSYGTPGAGQSFYQDSKNIRIFDNVGMNLERSFVTFGCTGGGQVYNNEIDGYGESCVFGTHHLNSAWTGRSVIRDNTFNNGVLTDIASNGIEIGGVERVDCYDNVMDSSGLASVVVSGCVSVRVKRNTSSNPGNATKYPYGPFSERYGFNQGLDPIAGNPTSSRAHFVIGSLGSSGGGGISITDNILKDDRAEPAFPLQQTKNGPASIAGSVVFSDNDLTGIENEYELLDITVGSVWQSSVPLTTRKNVGDKTFSDHVVEVARVEVGEVGPLGIFPGFRPSSVTVYGLPLLGALGVQSHGEMSWDDTGVRNDFSISSHHTTAGNRVLKTEPEVCKLTDEWGTTEFGAEFVSWNEKGFTLNVQTAGIGCVLTCVCRP